MRSRSAKTRKIYVNVININVDIVFGEFEGGRVIVIFVGFVFARYI